MFDQEFEIPIEPMGEPRAKVRAFNGHASVYKDKKGTQWQSDLRAMLAGKMPPGAILGDGEGIAIDILAFVQRPEALSKVFSKGNKPKYNPEPWFSTKKPDLDNLAKIVMDGLVPWIPDDKAVVGLRVVKCWTELGGIPRLWLRIRTLPLGGEEIQSAPPLVLEYAEFMFPKLSNEPRTPWTAKLPF